MARKEHPAIDGEVTLEQFQTLGHMAIVQELRNLTRTDELLLAMETNRHIAYTVTKFWSFPHILTHTDLIAMRPTDFARLAAMCGWVLGYAAAARWLACFIAAFASSSFASKAPPISSTGIPASCNSSYNSRSGFCPAQIMMVSAAMMMGSPP